MSGSKNAALRGWATRLGIGSYNFDIVARFWTNVVCVTYDRGCWIWCGHTDRDGYGLIEVHHRGKKRFRAHRLSWKIHFGELPKYACVLHRCDNPSCVRPDHLWLGDAKDNKADCVSKGRHVHGETHPSSTLSKNQVLSIRAKVPLPYGGIASLAKEMGVNYSAVYDVVIRRTWKHI